MTLLSVSISSVTLGLEGEARIFPESFYLLRYLPPPAESEKYALAKNSDSSAVAPFTSSKGSIRHPNQGGTLAISPALIPIETKGLEAT